MSSFYEGVKDSVRENSDSSDEGDGNSANYSTLKKAAESNNVEEDEVNDETPIEVLDEGLEKQNRIRAKTKDTQRDSVKKQQNNQSSVKSERSDVTAGSNQLEEKLDKIIEQNARMIEILESFGN